MPDPVNRRLIANAVATRLLQVSNATRYYGAIGRPLPGQDPATAPAMPPAKSDTDRRVAPYLIYFPAPGSPGDERDLADTHTDVVGVHQVTAVAGDVEDLLALVDRIDAVLHRWAPTVAGHVCGPLRVPPGFDVGVATDRGVEPHRLYAPLQYQLQVTT